MFAEGMVDDPTPSHPHAEDIVSAGWGSYFYYPLPERPKVTSTRAGSAFLQKAPSFDSSVGNGNTNQLPPRAPSVQNEEMKRAITLRRVSSMKTAGDAMEAASIAAAGFAAAAADGRGGPIPITTSTLQRQRRSGSHCPSYGTNVSEPPSRGSTPSLGSHNLNPAISTNTLYQPLHEGITSVGLPGYGFSTVPAYNTAAPKPDEGPVKGMTRINTLWGTYVRDYAKMCIPDVDVLVDYPIDYEFPTFYRDKHGNVNESGFFPSDPISLHADPPHFINTERLGSNSRASNMSANVSSSHSKTNLSLPQNTTSDSSNNNGEGTPPLKGEKED
jgi:hypothetical protein